MEKILGRWSVCERLVVSVRSWLTDDFGSHKSYKIFSFSNLVLLTDTQVFI